MFSKHLAMAVTVIGANLSLSFYRRSGAQGSRLTGAGWGGCTVSLVPADVLPTFLARVHEAYYQGSGRGEAPGQHGLFATKPGGGALVFLEA